MKIAVLFGGTSEDRDVSIASAAQIIPALRSLGHEVHAVDTATGRLSGPAEQKLLTSRVAPEPPTTAAIDAMRSGAVTLSPAAFDIRDVDVVFLALHGGAGEDGRIQAMLDLASLAYTGSNHIASAAAMDQGSVQAPVPLRRRADTRLADGAGQRAACWELAWLARRRKTEQAGFDGWADGGARCRYARGCVTRRAAMTTRS
jgi:hypothetical protein